MLYETPMLVTTDVRRLLHAANADTIQSLLKKLILTAKRNANLNCYREKAGLKHAPVKLDPAGFGKVPKMMTSMHKPVKHRLPFSPRNPRFFSHAPASIMTSRVPW